MAAKRFCCLFFLSLLLGATGSIGSITVKAADWPAWRYDAARSATSPHAIPEKLSLQWIRQFAPPKPAWPEDTRLVFDGSYEPVVVGNTLFLASAQNDSITALDTHSGAEKWKFFAEGPIRFAPVSAKTAFTLVQTMVAFTVYRMKTDSYSGDLKQHLPHVGSSAMIE